MSVWRGCDIPEGLWFDVPRDVWLDALVDGSIRLGMTDVAQTRAGKLLAILFKKPGRHVEAGQSAATVESAKWAGPFPVPVAGTIVDTNEQAFKADILIANRDPYGAGWLVRLEPDAWDPGAAGLVTGESAARAYVARIEELGVSCFRCADEVRERKEASR
jgi:glycine cleavage system H protein